MWVNLLRQSYVFLSHISQFKEVGSPTLSDFTENSLSVGESFTKSGYSGRRGDSKGNDMLEMNSMGQVVKATIFVGVFSLIMWLSFLLLLINYISCSWWFAVFKSSF